MLRAGLLWPNPGPIAPPAASATCGGTIAAEAANPLLILPFQSTSFPTLPARGAVSGTEGRRFDSCRARLRNPRKGGGSCDFGVSRAIDCS